MTIQLDFGSFILEGNTITWEVITDESGAEFIRLTIVAEDGSETVVEIPVGTGNFGQDPDTGGSGWRRLMLKVLSLNV